MSRHLLFEFGRNMKSLLITLVSTLVLLLVFLSFYPTFETEAEEFKLVLENFPAEMLTAMGIEIDLFMSFAGFFSYVYTYVMLALCIYAMNLGLFLMSNESATGSSDFLYSKPVGRFSIFIDKFFVGLVFVGVFNGFMLITVFVLMKFFNENDAETVSDLLLAGLVLSLIFYILGFTLGQHLKLKKTLGISSGIVFGFFMILMMGRLVDIEWVQNLSPFGWMDMNKILSDGLNMKVLLLISLGSISLWIYSAIYQQKRDIL